jgi:hypothetical protein
VASSEAGIDKDGVEVHPITPEPLS